MSAEELSKDVAYELMGRRVCAACEGEGYIWETNPGHEECCGPEKITCRSCGGRGWERTSSSLGY